MPTFRLQTAQSSHAEKKRKISHISFPPPISECCFMHLDCCISHSVTTFIACAYLSPAAAMICAPVFLPHDNCR